MYEKHFSLSRLPFPPTPDTSLYYPATCHESAIASLRRGLAENESLVLLTGEPGIGKTLVAYSLLERMPEDIVNAFLTNCHLADRAALLQAILYDLGLPFDEGTEQTLRLRLTDQLLKTCTEKRRTILVIDEAHLLSADLLEELRLLANLEAGGNKAIQMVLLAQPGILATLRQPGLESLHQRIAVRPVLLRLEVEEAYDYLLHHLRLAGGKPEKIFDDTALETIARGAHGIPRCLNQAAHQAMALAAEGELAKVDAEAVLEALTLLGLSASDPSDSEAHPNIQHFQQSA
ncbi:MAG: AAA family ATPase [Planctomycetes bacterium]|nr:AAA family ATPase [Planctomycetota bacterium]